MKKGITNDIIEQENIECSGVIEEVLREGARKMLQTAIENEVAEYIEAHENIRDANGHRRVVQNGYLPQRELVTGIGKKVGKKGSEGNNRCPRAKEDAAKTQSNRRRHWS